MKNFTRIFTVVVAMIFMVTSMSAQKIPASSLSDYEVGSNMAQRDLVLFSYDFEADAQGWTITDGFCYRQPWTWGNDASYGVSNM